MLENWLTPALPEARFSRISLDKAEHLPAPEEYDGYLLTGCRHGVYDDLAWKDELQQFLLKARDTETPLGGVCFGHQIMAQTFGSEVRKSANGWVVGKEIYADKSAIAIHQDQVLSAPEGARSIAGTTRCPIGRIDYTFPAISIQYHPEFPTQFIRALLQAWRNNPIPATHVDAAATDLNESLNRDAIALDFAHVFRSRSNS